MNLLNPRYWFQKRSSTFAAAGTELLNRMRYNALFALDPNVLVRHLVAFNSGDIAGLEHVIEEFENREDKMKIGAFKMSAAVASKPWEVRIARGEEDNERAKLHKEVLTRFWNRVEATDAFCRNRRGGLRLLVKQMMSAQSRVYAVHDVTWTVRGDGELEALFTFVPAWMFENRTGELRFIRDPGAYTGETMKDGEWLVTVGEGVGISAAILAMAKRLSWNDWLLFSEKCGMPVIFGNTGAKEDTPAWKNLLNAIANVAPKTGVLADLETKLQAVQVGGSSGQTTYRELIDVVDRGISALYRGGDLATISQAGDSVGSDSQDGESELMDGDGCALVSETLHRQIDRHVIRFSCGDFEPLAGIVINPPEEIDDVDRDIKVDQHLGEFGIRLSKKDMLARYGRVEATDENDAAIRQQAQQPGFGGFGGLPNEKISHIPAGQSKGAGQRQPGDEQGKESEDVLKAFAQDTGPAADAIQEFLKDPSKEAAEALLNRLPDLIPEDPAMAAVIAEAMAKEFGAGGLSNEAQRVPSGHGNGGQFTGKTNQPRGTTKEPHDKGFQDNYGNGNPETLAADPKMNVERGKAVISHIMGKKEGYEPHAMYRKDVGWIGVDYGTPGAGKNFDGGHGISHVVSKHPGAIDGVVDILQNGTAYKHDESKRKIYLIKDRTAVVLSKSRDNRLLITGFENLSDTQMKEYTSKGVYHAKGEN